MHTQREEYRGSPCASTEKSARPLRLHWCRRCRLRCRHVRSYVHNDYWIVRLDTRRQARLEAGAQRTLEAVACTPWLEWGDASWGCGWDAPKLPPPACPWPAHEARTGSRCPPYIDSNTMVVLLEAHSTPLRRSRATAYWITSSAWKRRVGGSVRPRAWAVLRLITSSNFMGRSTGRSPGLALFKILST
jgi:hypothetical protein